MGSALYFSWVVVQSVSVDSTACLPARRETSILPCMRIATWNLERPTPKQTVKNGARLEKSREIDADI